MTVIATERLEPLTALVASPIKSRAGLLTRMASMARVAVRMMFHDKAKFAGTLIGVVFAVLLSNQQAGTFLGLIGKNLMFVDNCGADIWIAPPSTQALQPSKPISDANVFSARGIPGVAWAEPIIYSAAAVALPTGGSEQVTLIGTRYPEFKGGPWNLIKGDKEVLTRPYTMIFEDYDRDKLGALNLGSMREVSGKQIQVGGFTWGLIPFGPSYAFAEYDLARELTKMPRDQVNYVLIGLVPGADPETVKNELQRQAPDVLVLTKSDFRKSIVKFILTRTAIGVTFGTSTIFGLIVGFVIVALSMFSSVVDNIREFGTLKAIGATNLDLAFLLWVQAVLFALIGSLVGLGLVTRIASAARSPQLAMNLPPQLLGGTVGVIILMCLFASSLALFRVSRAEPSMVFR